MRSATSLFLLGALGVACSSNDDGAADAGACTVAPELLVAASDYQSSAVCGAPCCVSPGSAELGDDPWLALSNGRAFYISRTGAFGDVLFELDARTGRPTAKIDGLHELAAPGQTANPHDVAAAPDGTLFVPLYSVPRLAFVKDGAVTGSLDLSAYDPEDGNPQAEAVRIVGDKAYVTLERLDDGAGLASTRSSQMLRVDVATRTVEATIELAGRNPFGSMSELGSALYLAEPGNFNSAADTLAGVERFDTATSETRLLVTEDALGGSVAEVAVTDGCGVAIVAGPEDGVNPTWAVAFDPTTGAVLGTIFGPTPGYDLQGLAWRGGTLYLGDRRSDADGTWPVHVFERGAGCALTLSSRTIPLPLRPVALRPTSETP